MPSRTAVAATVACVLLACGGGGGSDGGTTPGSPSLTIEPAALGLAFGPVASGGVLERTVTLRNDGTGTLHVDAVASADPLAAPFSLVSDGCSGQALDAGAACTFAVRFEPSALGAFGDSFEVATDDPGTPWVQLATSGQAGPALSGSGGGTWRYYLEFPVENQEPLALPAQQVHAYLATASYVAAGMLQASLADLRFTDASGAVELPHWCEAWDAMYDTAATVKVDLPAGTTSIRMYFGNPSALPGADGRATFEVFDDFEDGVLDTAAWTVASGVTATEEGGYLKIANATGPRAAVMAAAYSGHDVAANAFAKLVAGPAVGDPEFGFVLRGSVEAVLAGGSAQQMWCRDGATTGFKSDVEIVTGSRYWIEGSTTPNPWDPSPSDHCGVFRFDPVSRGGYGNSGTTLATADPGPVGILASPGTEVWLESFRVEKRGPYGPMNAGYQPTFNAIF